jgi:hypothetical protein
MTQFVNFNSIIGNGKAIIYNIFEKEHSMKKILFLLTILTISLQVSVFAQAPKQEPKKEKAKKHEPKKEGKEEPKEHKDNKSMTKEDKDETGKK